MRQSTCLCYAWQFTCLELRWSCHDSLQTAKTVFWSWSCHDSLQTAKTVFWSWSWCDSLQTAKTVFWSWSCYGWQSTCRDAALNKNPLVLKLPCMTIQFGFPCTAACDRFNSYINIFCCFFLSACIKERKRWLYVIICVWNCVQFKKKKNGSWHSGIINLSSGIFIAWFYYMFWVWSVPFAIFFHFSFIVLFLVSPFLQTFVCCNCYLCSMDSFDLVYFQSKLNTRTCHCHIEQNCTCGSY